MLFSLLFPLQREIIISYIVRVTLRGDSTMEQRNIKKETRARNLLYRYRTLQEIKDYIYEQTGCEKCRRGEFCSRDGDKWGCLSYNNIAQHLNHIRHPSSRGNTGLWQTKTVRDQITLGKRVLTEQEKLERKKQRDRERDEQVVWEYYDAESYGEVELLSEHLSRIGVSVAKKGSNVDDVTESVREKINWYHQRGRDVSIIV